MPEGPPKSIKKTEHSPEGKEKADKNRVGSVVDSMNVNQEHHYDARAEVYDRQNEMAHRAERIKRIDAYYFRKLERILSPGGLTYLDFGCATGAHTGQFIAGLKSNHVEEGYGIDISGKMVALAAQELPEFEFIKGGAEKIYFENKFDLVTSFFHVLGHLTEAELELFFQNVSRSLKPGGILCFDVIKDIGRLRTILANRSISQKKPKYFIYNSKLPDGSVVKGNDGKPLTGSIRMFSKEEIIDFAQKNNLEIVELKTQPSHIAKELTVILRKKSH